MKKPNVTFYLKDGKKKGSEKSALIMANFSYHGKRARVSTGLNIKSSNWDEDKALPKKSFADYSEYKQKLFELEGQIFQVYKEFVDKGIIPEPSTIKQHVQNTDKLLHESDIKSVQAVFSEFMEEKRLEVKKLTIKKYLTLQNVLLKEYEKAYKCTLSFDSMDLLFEKRFKHFLTSVRENSNNAVSKSMDCLKVFLKWAHKKGYHNHLYYTEFSSPRTKTPVIYLELAEFQAVLNLNLADQPKLKKVRDWFCFQCFAGQRISDIENMKWQDLVTTSEGHLEWHLYQVKGNKPEMIVVPLVEPAVAILNNLKGENTCQRVFVKISNQKFNNYIKDVCKLAGITSHVNYVTYSGKTAKDKSGPKYKFISSHTARKTFVTISKFYGGMSNEAIRAVTGHANDKMLNMYIGQDKKHVASEIQRVWGNI